MVLLDPTETAAMLVQEALLLWPLVVAVVVPTAEVMLVIVEVQ